MSKQMMKPFKVDKTKFDAELNKRNISRTEVSFDIGRNRNYLNSCMCEGRIPATEMLLIEAKYGIKPQDVAPDKEPKETIKRPDEVQQIELILSDETISKLEVAMFRAFTAALKGEM